MTTVKNIIVNGTSSFYIDFDLSIGNERIQSIAGGGAVDDFNYLMVYDPTGEAREFTFDFTNLKKTIYPTSTLNIIIRVMDVDGIIHDWKISKQNGVEAGYSLVSNPRIASRSDGSNLIDIFYDYSSPLEIDPATVAVAISGDGGITWLVPTTSTTGDIGLGVSVGPNKRITWDPTVDMPDGGEVVVAISIYSTFGGSAIGQFQTGTLVVSKSETTAPIVRVSGVTKPQYAVKGGNLYKNNSFDFTIYESSSESSESSVSSKVTSSQSSSSTSSKSSSSSFMKKLKTRIACGDFSSFGIKSDGTALMAGYCYEGDECLVGGWSSIMSVEASTATSGYTTHVLGVKTNGQVVGSGTSSSNQLDVSGWLNITAVACGGYHSIGLQENGEVVATGDNSEGQCNVTEWSDIVAVAAGSYHSLGLKSDGTVVGAGKDDYGQVSSVNSWSDITAIACGLRVSLGLKSNGTVVAAGDLGGGDVSTWSDIVGIASGYQHSLGVKSNGSVVATGDNGYGQCDTSSWTNIISVGCGWAHSIGLKSDGTVVGAGYNGDGILDVSGWNLLE